MKRILSIFLSAAILFGVFSSFSFNAFAFVTEDGFQYELIDDNTVEITGYTGNADPLNIPNLIMGKTVVSIGDMAFINNTNISEVRMPDCVKNIGMAAFYSCSFITEIELSGGLETIGEDAFANCARLGSIYFGKNVMNLNGRLFDGCSNLKTITVSKDNPNYRSLNGVLLSKDLSRLVRFPANYEDSAYGVPETVFGIDEYAFSGAKNLTDLFLSKGIEKINDNAFINAGALNKVSFSGSAAQWGEVYISDTGNSSLKNINADCGAAYCAKGVKGEVEKYKDSTCSAAGEEEYYCKTCGDFRKDVVAKKQHTCVTDKAVAATFFTTGKTKGSHCSVCKTVITKQKTVAKLVLATPKKLKVTAAKKGFKVTYARNSKATGYQIQYSTSKKFTKKTTVTKNIKKNKTVSYTYKNKKLKKKKQYYVRVRAYVKSGKKTAYSKWSATKGVKTK